MNERHHLEDTSAEGANQGLPARLAFVVQLSTEAEVQQGAFRGRVEHVLSGRRAHFQSLDELQAFLQRTVASLPQSWAVSPAEEGPEIASS